MKLSAFTAAVCVALTAFGTASIAAETSHQGQTYWTSANQSSLNLKGDVKVEGDYKWGIHSGSETTAVTAPDELANLEFIISDEQLKGESASKKPSDAIKAENGGKVTFGVADKRTLNNLTVTVNQAEPIKGRQDTVGIHALGGSVEAYTNGNITITAPSEFGGQAVMVQNSGNKVGTLVLDALGDVTITTKNTNAVVQGAITDNNGSTSLTIKGQNVTIATSGAQKDAFQIYDTKWEKEGTFIPGTNTTSITAVDKLSISSDGQYAVRVQRNNVAGESTTDAVSFTANTVEFSGAASALVALGTAQSQNDIRITANSAVLKSNGTGTATLDAGAYNTVNFTGHNGSTSTVRIENTNTQGSAIKLSGADTASTANAATLKLSNTALTVAGRVDAENGVINLVNKSDFHLEGDNKMVAHQVSLDKTSTITYDTTKAGALDFGTQPTLGEGKLVASSTFQGNFATREEAVAVAKKVVKEGSSIYTQEMAETKLWGTTTIDKDGNFTATDSDVLSSVKNFSALTAVQWRNEVERLEQRLGEVRANNGALGAWARVYGGNAKAEIGSDVKVKTNSIQVGADYAVNNWIYGAAFSYTKGDGDFTNGSGSSDSYNLAAYATSTFGNGLYVDAVARFGLLKTDFDAAYNDQALGKFSASADNTAYGLSVQTGWKYDLTPTFFVEPQAQLAYGFVKGDTFESDGVKIDQDNIQSLVGRVGTLLGARFQEGKGRVFLHASVNHDFLGDADSTATWEKSVAHNNVDLGGTWYTYGFGLQAEPVKNLSVYATLDRSNGSEYTDEYRYSLGARYAF